MKTRMRKTAARPLRVGLIGCGGRGAGLLWMLKKAAPDVAIAGIADPDPERPRRLLAQWQVPVESVPWFPDEDALLEHADGMDGLILATRCHQHAPMAVKAAATGLPLYLEKPVAVDRAQLARLAAAFRGREDRVVVSFPLRVIPVFRKVCELLRAGRIGAINQVQAVNNVSYGGHYYGGHYRNYDESGGLWLQKATHDFDALNVLMNMRPEIIAAVSTQKVFGGERPHRLRCSGCDRTRTCLESPANIAGVRGGDAGGVNWDDADHYCAFSRQIRNQDAGSALIRYADGTHVNYTQNFVARRSAQKRGAIVTGYSGTIEFDYDGALRIVSHHDRREEERAKVVADGTHGGGDDVLMQSFVDVMRGEAASVSPLSAGILSAAMTLAARESAWTHQFVKVRLPAATAWPYPRVKFPVRRPEPHDYGPGHMKGC